MTEFRDKDDDWLWPAIRSVLLALAMVLLTLLLVVLVNGFPTW